MSGNNHRRSRSVPLAGTLSRTVKLHGRRHGSSSTALQLPDIKSTTDISAPPAHFPADEDIIISDRFNTRTTLVHDPSAGADPAPKADDDPQKPPTSSTSTTTKPSKMAAALSALTWLRIPLAISSIVTVGASGLLYWKQNDLIYARNIPPDARITVPRAHQFPEYEWLTTHTEEVTIATPDGEKLHAFLIESPTIHVHEGKKKKVVTILTFHGNAGNVGHRLPIGAELARIVPGCRVLMLEYRGYGLSTGTPDEKGINVDAQSALDFIKNHEELSKTDVILYGQSIGGAVATAVATRNPHGPSGQIKALILENTFLSLKKMIPSVLPAGKYISMLCHQVWPTESTLPTLDPELPVLFLSGLRDEIVPPEHMQRLFGVCRTRKEKKVMRIFVEGDHNSTIMSKGFFAAIAEFVDRFVT